MLPTIVLYRGRLRCKETDSIITELMTTDHVTGQSLYDGGSVFCVADVAFLHFQPYY